MLFHKDIGFPNVKIPSGTIELSYTGHARYAAVNDKYGNFVSKLPMILNTAGAEVIELDVFPKTDTVTKIVYRIPFTSQHDMILVVIPTPGQDNIIGIVKTTWLNARSDTHQTLQKNKYHTMEDFLNAKTK